MITVYDSHTLVPTQAEERCDMVSRTLLLSGGGEKRKGSTQSLSHKKLVASSHCPAAHWSFYLDGHTAEVWEECPGPLCGFIAAKLSTGLPWAGLRGRESCRGIATVAIRKVAGL